MLNNDPALSQIPAPTLGDAQWDIDFFPADEALAMANLSCRHARGLLASVVVLCKNNGWTNEAARRVRRACALLDDALHAIG